MCKLHLLKKENSQIKIFWIYAHCRFIQCFPDKKYRNTDLLRKKLDFWCPPKTLNRKMLTFSSYEVLMWKLFPLRISFSWELHAKILYLICLKHHYNDYSFFYGWTVAYSIPDYRPLHLHATYQLFISGSTVYVSNFLALIKTEHVMFRLLSIRLLTYDTVTETNFCWLFMKFGIGVLHTKLFSKCKFHENQLSDFT